MVAATRTIGQLADGDCFFYQSADDYAAREVRLLELNDFRASLGDQRFTAVEMANMIRATASGYMVYAVVRATGERCTLRMSDGKREIWYDSNAIVQYAPDRRAFDDRLVEMRKANKMLSEAQDRMKRARSKKKNQSAEIEERTLRTAV